MVLIVPRGRSGLPKEQKVSDSEHKMKAVLVLFVSLHLAMGDQLEKVCRNGKHVGKWFAIQCDATKYYIF